MKYLTGLICAGTALEASLVSAQARVYISDATTLRPKEALPSISPHTARLLFAQRLSLSQYHSLADADESILSVLNAYGGKQEQIFAHEEQRPSIDRLLLIIDGVANPDDILDQSVRPSIIIESQPSSSQNKELAIDLLEQSQHSRSKEDRACHFQFPSASTLQGGLSSSRMERHDCDQLNERMLQDADGASKTPQLSIYKDLYNALGSEVDGRTIILHDASLQNLSPKNSEHYTAVLSELKTFIKHLYQPNRHISSTIVLMPATSKPAKRSTTTSPYGTYLNPVSARQQQPEHPLSSPPNHPPSPHLLQTPPKPLPHRILPSCHDKLSTAIAATNNCSGHGTVYKKSTGAHDCYACDCSKTVLTDPEGRVKTVYWGGPACQKKDVSVPFFLLAGLSVALVGALTWGVGLLMSVGAEELPSVIGAGVAGPRASK